MAKKPDTKPKAKREPMDPKKKTVAVTKILDRTIENAKAIQRECGLPEVGLDTEGGILVAALAMTIAEMVPGCRHDTRLKIDDADYRVPAEITFGKGGK